MRRYEGGEIVGEVDPPIDFEQWLSSEIAQARKVIEATDRQVVQRSGHARLYALQEAQRAYERRKQ